MVKFIRIVKHAKKNKTIMTSTPRDFDSNFRLKRKYTF